MKDELPAYFVVVDDKEDSINTFKEVIEDVSWIERFNNDKIIEVNEKVKALARQYPKMFSNHCKFLSFLTVDLDTFQKAREVLENCKKSILWLDLNLHQSANNPMEQRHQYSEQLSNMLKDEQFHEICASESLGGCILALSYRPCFSQSATRVLVPASDGTLPEQIISQLSTHEGFRQAFVNKGYPIRGLAINAQRAIIAGLTRWIELREKRHPLDQFWENTKTWFQDRENCYKAKFPHDFGRGNMGWKELLQETLSSYTGSVDNWFQDDATMISLHENLKTLTGVNSFYSGGTMSYPLSTYAAYIVFLMGAHNRLKEGGDPQEMAEAKRISWEGKERARGAYLFRGISGHDQCDKQNEADLHKRCAKAIFDLGYAFGQKKNVSDTVCPISSPDCHQLDLTIKIKVDDPNATLRRFKEAIKAERATSEEVSRPENLLRTLHESGLLGWQSLGAGRGGQILLESQKRESSLLIHFVHHDQHRFVLLGD